VSKQQRQQRGGQMAAPFCLVQALRWQWQTRFAILR
jgi:hypothetical protein